MSGSTPSPGARSRGLFAVCAAGLLAIAGVVAMVVLVSGPQPDAKLREVAGEPDVQVLALLAGEEPYAGIDVSTLRGYEPYLNYEVWSAQNIFGSQCLIAINRELDDVVDVSCVPVSVELFVDALGRDLPPGMRIRFIQRGDLIDAYEYPPLQEP